MKQMTDDDAYNNAAMQTMVDKADNKNDTATDIGSKTQMMDDGQQRR